LIFGKHINKYYLRYLPAFLLGLIALVVVDYVQLMIPEFYGSVINGLEYGFVEIDGVTHTFDMNFLLDKICLPMILVILTIIVGRFVWRMCFRGASVRMETRLRGEMFDHCKDLSQQYYQVNKVGNLMTFFTNDIETVQDCFGWGVLMLCDAVFLFVLAIIKMWALDPMLTLLSLIPMALLIGIGAVLDHHLEKKWDARQAAFSALSDFSQETFSGIAVVKAFVKETIRMMSFKDLNITNEKTNVERTKLATLLNILVTLFVESVICVILGYGGYLAYTGKFDGGTLVEFIGYFTSLVWPITAVSQLVEMHSRGKASLKRIGELLEAKPDVCDSPEVTEPAEALKGNIEFRNLTFRHPGAEYDALTDISFTINAGEHVGIIGKTGAGKTTLVDLILRTYNVPDGTLFIDGYDVNKIPIRTVRQHASYVPQDNFLFSDTITNNIAFACDNISDETVEQAARYADIHDNISEFAKKYETLLGERGVTVSGGQKQRISIARALLKDAATLILDDSVSAVDVKTEKVILDNLRKIRNGKTTILIAHRISTIESMDKIVFIDDGRIVATGTHNELYAKCPAYHNMVELQRLDDESPSNQHSNKEVTA